MDAFFNFKKIHKKSGKFWFLKKTYMCVCVCVCVCVAWTAINELREEGK
jgi:hypothetical protein